MKTRQVGAELFHVDRRTDRRDEVNSNFSQFCESAYNHIFLFSKRNEALEKTRPFCYNWIFYASIEFLCKKPECNVQRFEAAVRNYTFSFISVSISSNYIVRTKWKVIFSWIPKLFLTTSFTFEVSFVKSFMKILLKFDFSYAKLYRAE